MEKEIKEITFGAKDSELYKFEYSIPEGYEAEIKDGKVIITKRESEDEKIREGFRRLLNGIRRDGGLTLNKVPLDKCFAYLEKQKEQKPVISDEAIRDGVVHFGITQYQIDNWLKKHINVVEQKPAEWSDEEKKHLYNAIEAVKYVYDVSEGTSGFKCVEFLKSLRSRPKSSDNWKPSEEQMEALKDAFRKDGGNEYRKVINSLYRDLEKLL